MPTVKITQYPLAHALDNHCSGVVGEMRIATELLRCGIKTAKPYWNNDEIDLLCFWSVGKQVIPLPIQVKSIQFLPTGCDNKNPNNRTVQGLKKSYVERNKYIGHPEFLRRGLCELAETVHRENQIDALTNSVFSSNAYTHESYSTQACPDPRSS